MDKNLAPFGKGVYHRNAYAVEAAGDFIGLFVEFAPGVETGHDQFQGADALRGVDVYGDSAAVVLDTDYVVPFQNHQDFAAIALSGGGINSHGLVYGVIYYLKNQVVQAVQAGGADVHAGALADSFKTFQNLNILGGIIGIHLFILLILNKKVKVM
jgi:hypothetical protein